MLLSTAAGFETARPTDTNERRCQRLPTALRRPGNSSPQTTEGLLAIIRKHGQPVLNLFQRIAVRDEYSRVEEELVHSGAEHFQRWFCDAVG